MSSRILKYLGAFGISGFSLYFKTKGARAAYTLQPPGVRTPLQLRPGVTDRRTFDQVFVARQYDVEFPGEPQVIVDAGANIGLASLWFAHRWPNARIVAIEPEERNFQLLQQNVRAFPQITPVRGALWSHGGSVCIANPEAAFASFRVGERKDDAHAVDAFTVPDLMRMHGFERIDILKMDIEGGEREVFAAPEAQQWLKQVRMLIVELHERYSPGCEAVFDKAIASFAARRWKSGENEVALS